MLEVINSVKEVTGEKIDFNIMPKRNGDPPELIAEVDGAINTLKWKSSKPNLIEQISDTWNWHKKYFG